MMGVWNSRLQLQNNVNGLEFIKVQVLNTPEQLKI